MSRCPVVSMKMKVKAYGYGCDENTAIYECYQSIGRDVRFDLENTGKWPLCHGDCEPEVIEGRSYKCGCYLLITLTKKIKFFELRDDYAVGAGCPEGSHPKGAEYTGDVLLKCECLPSYAYGDACGVVIPVAEKHPAEK